MKKSMFVFACLLYLSGVRTTAVAQTDSIFQKHHVAIFVPLYLDSAFDAAGDYQYGKNFPKFLNPGLEFYEGVQLAADSLNKTGASLEIHIYDTRSAVNPVSRICQQPEFSKTELMIGQVAGNEIRLLADVAKNKNIPFINVNVPNDAGVTNNPFYVILNSTLKTHVQGIYQFLQRYYATTPIVVFRKSGVQEDILLNYLREAERTTAGVPLRLTFITLTNTLSGAELVPYLDSTRETMCVAATLDEAFAKHLAQHLATLNESYPVQLMGMPTWDGIKEFEKKEYKGLNIFYSTPFYNAKMDKVSNGITGYFRANLYSRPTDMVFRGYECMMRFGKLLVAHGVNTASSITERKYKVFADFDIQPVFLNKQNPTLDYFENKKLYFVKMVDGNIKSAY